MEILGAVEARFLVSDEIFNFSFEGEDSNNVKTSESNENQSGGSLPEIEEELEWLSNKDAFPPVDPLFDTFAPGDPCFGILSDNPELLSNHQSPISVLENSSNSSNGKNIKVPKNHPTRNRTNKRKRREDFGDLSNQHFLSQVMDENGPEPVTGSTGIMGRRCLHCQVDKTPQWRAGPMGPKTLCNACGVRYKSGRLLPEYRPANSPTFSRFLHSNSHRKVVEMRRQNMVATGDGNI